MESEKKAAGGNRAAKSTCCGNCKQGTCKKARLVLWAKLPNEQERRATGQVAKTLRALITAGPKGITALEVSSWALRLSAYVFILRHEWGLEIERERETHANGWHGRWFLKTIVIILPERE